MLLLLLLLLVPQDPAEGIRARLEAAQKSPEAWQRRREEIRRQILCAAGLYPEFERPPLRPKLFGRVEHEDYIVEKVDLETLPGLHLTGNLYRPKGKTGPFPGVLCPHGHWKEGRFVDGPLCSHPGQALSFAKLGFVAFTYDMVGFGDFRQLPHAFQDPASGIGLFGLQTWNSLRALDFLESLPDVDPRRLGCTGESGGGTQTFVLAAIDERVRCSAPVCMVAAEFQGGCSCENAPFLRLGLNNVELAAMVAPRPQILVAATGDWTKHVPTLEAPIVAAAYAAHDAAGQFRAVQFDAPHNYHKESREAVYAWFAHALQGAARQDRIAEPPFQAGRPEALAVWSAEHPLPAGACDAEALQKLLRAKIAGQVAALFRSIADRRELAPKFGELLRVAAGLPPELRPAFDSLGDPTLAKFRRMRLQGAAEVDLHVSSRPWSGGNPTLVVVPSFREDDPLLKKLDEAGLWLMVLPLGAHGAATPAGGDTTQVRTYPATYHRTALGWRIHDVAVALAATATLKGALNVDVVATGDTGLAALLANAVPLSRPATGRFIADLSTTEDPTHPGLQRFGGAAAAPLIGAARRWVLHHTTLDAAPLRRVLGDDVLLVAPELWTPERIVEVLTRN